MRGDLGPIPGFDPWVGKIPWKKERLLTPVFWPGEFHGLNSWKESDLTERLSHFHLQREGVLPQPGPQAGWGGGGLLEGEVKG